VRLHHRALAFLLRGRHDALVGLPALADASPWHRLLREVASYGDLPDAVQEQVARIAAELDRRAEIAERARRVTNEAVIVERMIG
jgi:hypothetical protein